MQDPAAAPAQDIASEIARYPHGRVPRALRERQLLELAEALFAERGYGGASMDELARRAGVTKPVIYDLIGSKEELYRRCVQRAADELYERVAAAVAEAADPPARLRAGSLAFFRFVAEHRRSWEMLFTGDPGPFSAEAAGIRARQTGLVIELMDEAARALGASIDPRRLSATAHALNGAYEALAHWWYANPDVPPEALADWLVEMVLPGLQQIAAGRA